MTTTRAEAEIERRAVTMTTRPRPRLAGMHPRYRRLLIPCALAALLLIVVLTAVLKHA